MPTINSQTYGKLLDKYALATSMTHGADRPRRPCAAAPERHHDDQLGAEHEAGILRRRDGAESHIAEPGERSDDGRDDQQADADPRGVDAEIAATLVIVTHRALSTRPASLRSMIQ